MMITEIKHGGMEIAFYADELHELALLMDETAHIVRESPDQEDMREGHVRHLELLAAIFTVASVACKAQDYSSPSKSVWFKRETGTPVLHNPD